MNTLALRDAAFGEALSSARSNYRAGDFQAAFRFLERAHVLGQSKLGQHWTVHVWMLRVGWRQRDAREIVGQLLRLVLTPLGHLTGRLPIGNTGGASVSAFAPMPIPDELLPLLDADPAAPSRSGKHNTDQPV